MYKKKCPYCDSPVIKKYGVRSGVQLYKCNNCGRQFRGGERATLDDIWELYMDKNKALPTSPSPIMSVSPPLRENFVKLRCHGSNQILLAVAMSTLT